MAEQISEQRIHAALLVAGQIGAMVSELDLEALEHYQATMNPGPRVYVEMIDATIEFVKRWRRIQAGLGHERAQLKAEVEAMRSRLGLK